MFGLFDLCCVNKDQVMFAQVTSNRPHTHKKYSEFSEKFFHPKTLIKQFVWVNYKGWKEFDYRNGIKRLCIK